MEEENGKSIGDIFRIAWSQKWLALIIAAAITIVGTLALYFGYSKNKAEYKISYRVILPLSGNEESGYRYPDGTLFNYLSIISKENLDGVSEKTGVKIDAEKMITDNGISISKATDEETKEVIRFVYEINVKQKYFNDKDAARTFLRGLATSSYDHLDDMKMSYDSSLQVYNQSDDYEERVTRLQEQMSYVYNMFSSLSSSYGELFVVNDGRTLKSYVDTIGAYLNNREYTNLRLELRSGKYVMNEDIIESYNYQMEQLDIDLAAAKRVLAEMQKGTGSFPADAESIRSQAQSIENIVERQRILGLYIDGAVIDTDGVFASRLETVYDKAVEFTQTLEDVVHTVYMSASNIQFNYVDTIKSEGGFGIIICGGISFVLGLIIAFIVAYIVGNSKLGKSGAGKASEDKPEVPEAETTK